MTTISFFKYKKNKYWAFTQMRLAYDVIKNSPGVLFFKLLGTGAGDGFSLFPDFSTYSIICVWKHESDALNFINNSDHSKVISQKAFSRQDFFLKTIKCHGKWDGVTPFVSNDTSLNEKNKIGIITRAKINKARLFEFWNSVPKASQAIKNAKGVEWCKGIGEWPFIQQATFSVWDNLESVKNFAYNKGAHSEIVRKTKKRNWYSEDLFARFEILHSELKIL